MFSAKAFSVALEGPLQPTTPLSNMASPPSFGGVLRSFSVAGFGSPKVEVFYLQAVVGTVSKGDNFRKRGLVLNRILDLCMMCGKLRSILTIYSFIARLLPSFSDIF